jgi:transposase
MQGRKGFEEKLFTNFKLSERVPSDNFYRKLTETLDLRFLRKTTAPYYGTEGQESIDPIVFFKLILIGYLENLGSDRRIINTVSMRLDMLFFIGYNIDDPLPWHSTLSRTRQLYGDHVFKELFRKVLKMCIDKGMVSGRRQAVDSALIKANASMDSIAEKAIMNDADQFADELTSNEDKPQKVRRKLKSIIAGNKKPIKDNLVAGLNQIMISTKTMEPITGGPSFLAIIPITLLLIKMPALL